MLNKIKDLLNHERYQMIALGLAVLICIWFVGCETEVESMLTPGEKVTRAELRAELDLYLTKAERRFSRLDQKDRIKKWIFENAVLVSETGTLNPQGLINTLFAVLGIGAITDNVRKRRDLKLERDRYVSEAKPKISNA